MIDLRIEADVKKKVLLELHLLHFLHKCRIWDIIGTAIFQTQKA